MKYKNLKSVAYSLGHGYFSLMNYTGRLHVFDHYFEIARETGLTSIKIDFLNQIINPPEFRNVALVQNLKSYREYFPRHLISQNCSIEHIKEVYIYLDIDLNKTEKSEHDSYICRVEILDDRNKLYSVTVPEWWKY